MTNTCSTYIEHSLSEAVQECDTPQTPQHDHDKCQN